MGPHITARGRACEPTARNAAGRMRNTKWRNDDNRDRDKPAWFDRCFKCVSRRETACSRPSYECVQGQQPTKHDHENSKGRQTLVNSFLS